MAPIRLFAQGLILAVALLWVASTPAQTSAFSYQGSLTDGVTPASGTYEMQFSLYDQLSGGTQIGSTITNNAVTVSGGVFTVQLDFSPATPFAAGADRWLEIAVRKASDPPGFTTLSPRQQLTSSPYAIRTISAAASDSLSAACVTCVTDGQINTVSGSKVTGTVANATTAVNVSGVVATANGGTGLNASGGGGNFLRSNGTTWVSSAIQSADVPVGSANYIQNLLTTSTAQIAASFHIAGSGRVDSRFFVNDPGQTSDVVSVASNATNAWAINGYSSFNGAGVYGKINTGNTAVWGAVQGEYLGTAAGDGVRGIYQGSASGTGVHGVNSSSNATGPQIGVRGFSSPTASGNQRIGVYGTYNTTQYGMGVAGVGFGGTLPTGNFDYGVVGWVGNNQNYSGYYNGNHVIANGTKSASVATSRGNQLLYATESPGVWFEDIGSSKLVNGTVEIKLDSLFLETVVIDDLHPMHVFIQMEGESQDVFVTKGKSSFVVQERNGGRSNAAFSYRIMAKRMNFQDHRFGSDPVWGPGDTRGYTQYAPAPPIDYEDNLVFQSEQRRNWRPTSLPPGFVAPVRPGVNPSPARNAGAQSAPPTRP